jgi:hypothetical protein
VSEKIALYVVDERFRRSYVALVAGLAGASVILKTAGSRLTDLSPTELSHIDTLILNGLA